MEVKIYVQLLRVIYIIKSLNVLKINMDINLISF